jgi:predicted Zn finger-like uncharacterized protein
MTGAAFTPGEPPSLFTQCPKCETVFKMSAEVLRAAGGQVRCGRCGEVFSALARLAEDASAFPAGESPLDMETRADQILHSAVAQPPQPAQPARPTQTAPTSEPEDLTVTDKEFARLQVLDLELYDDDGPAVPPRAPENKPKAGDDKTPPAGSMPKAAEKKAAENKSKPPAREEEAADDGSMEFTLPPGELDRIFVEPVPRPKLSAAASAAEPAEPPVEPPQGRIAGLEVSEDVRREMLAGINEPQLSEIGAQRRAALPVALWLGAAIVLALALGAQIIHQNRKWFAAHAPFGGSLRGMYSALGVAVPAPGNLAAYQLRQWGVTGDPGANGTLRVRASILNTSAQLQPYPLLRVTLANRFGAALGAREFEPAEYLGKPMVRMLAPGERVDATLDILDPGKDAEGFEIDVCLRGIDQKISCAGDVATQMKP